MTENLAPTLQPSQPAVVLDVETTGLSSVKDRIVQIGLCRTDTMEIQEWTVNTQGIPSNKYALAVHGISLAKTAKAPTLANIWPEIEEFCSGLPILAHNAIFDFRFIDRSIRREKIKPNSPQDFQAANWYDTMWYCRLCFPGRNGNKLDDLITYTKPKSIPKRSKLHDAKQDALLVAHCWNSPTLLKKFQQVPDQDKSVCNLSVIKDKSSKSKRDRIRQEAQPVYTDYDNIMTDEDLESGNRPGAIFWIVVIIIGILVVASI